MVREQSEMFLKALIGSSEQPKMVMVIQLIRSLKSFRQGILLSQIKCKHTHGLRNRRLMSILKAIC